MLLKGLHDLKVLNAYRNLLKTVKKKVPHADLKLIQKAFRFAEYAQREQKRLSGEPYIIHPLAVAQILADYGLDSATISAALLHDVVEDTVYGEDTIAGKFGIEISSLVKGVTKISTIKKQGTSEIDSNKTPNEMTQETAENIRMMLLATAKDVRVILIKLADKLHNMRTVKYHSPENAKRIAKEVLTIYASLAGRLGMYGFKSELEDLAFATLKPEENKEISDGINQSRSEVEKFIKNVSKIIHQRLAEINIQVKVEGRAKHHYSIYEKMKSQGITLDEIYDLRGIRVIVKEIRDCYGALGIVHTIWPPLQGRFRDYIATPKVNGYQSLHTTVLGPDGKPLEIQIRTTDMNELAEHGIASHWIYKTEPYLPNHSKLRWLQRLSQLTESTSDATEFIEGLRQELSPEEVYVFTPKGDIIDLPRGSTVLDFAFVIHTEVGLHCKGATVNDRIVPLRTELKSGDLVEIQTDKSQEPSPNWLRCIKSPRTRQKLRAYFRRDLDENISSEPKKEKSNIFLKNDPVPDKLSKLNELRIRRRKSADPKRVPIEIAGATDIPVRYAGCCSPVPGDRIVGFVTRGRGVTVHRSNCPYLPADTEERKRIIEVGWAGLTEKYPVHIEILARDRQGLYLDLVDGITRTYTNILKAEADIPRNDKMMMKAKFLIEVVHVDHIKEVVENLLAVSGVVSVERALDKQKQPQLKEIKSKITKENAL